MILLRTRLSRESTVSSRDAQIGIPPFLSRYSICFLYANSKLVFTAISLVEYPRYTRLTVFDTPQIDLPDA